MNTTVLNLSSGDRIVTSTATSTNFQLKLPSNINGVKSVDVLNIVMPNSLYRIVTGQNDSLDFNDTAVKSITIPGGAYTISSLTTQITSLLNAQSSGFTVTYSTDTFRITIARTSTFSLLFSSGSNAGTSCRAVIGFTATDLTGAMTYTGQNAANLYSPVNVFIQVNEFGSPNYTSAGLHYCFDCPLAVSSGGVMTFLKNSFYQQLIYFSVPKTLLNFTINVVLRDGSPVNLQNADWSMALLLTY